MNLIKQIGILFALCWISQIIHSLLPFELPVGIVGMVIVFVLLAARLLKMENIKDISDFLLSNMAFIFVPICVSAINYFEALKSLIIPLAVISVLSTFVTFGAAALSVKLTLKLTKGRTTNDGTV
jgi:holin-like protein